jgi:hypothetical protein
MGAMPLPKAVRKQIQLLPEAIGSDCKAIQSFPEAFWKRLHAMPSMHATIASSRSKVPPEVIASLPVARISAKDASMCSPGIIDAKSALTIGASDFDFFS